MDFSGVMAIVFEIPLFFGPPCRYIHTGVGATVVFHCPGRGTWQVSGAGSGDYGAGGGNVSFRWCGGGNPGADCR